MFGFKPRSPLDSKTEQFHVDCWAWLLRHTPHRKFEQTPLVLPTAEYFTPTAVIGAELGKLIFKDTCRLAQVGTHRLRLIPETVVESNLVDLMGYSHDTTCGTFGIENDDSAEIRYNAKLTEYPEKLIAVFAHELGHHVNGAIPEPPPGGWGNIEAATDLTATFLGFGVFHPHMFGTAYGRAAFKDSRTGQRIEYLSFYECAFDLAIFILLRRFELATIKPFTSPLYFAEVRRAVRYLQSSNRVQEIQQLARKPYAARSGRNFWADRDR